MLDLLKARFVFMYEFVRLTKHIWCTRENNYLLVYKLFEFPVKLISAIRNNVKIIFRSKNHFHYYNCWWKTKVYLRYYVAHLSLLFKLNSFFSLAQYSPGINNRREKKMTNNYMYIKPFLKNVFYIFSCQGDLKYVL